MKVADIQKMCSFLRNWAILASFAMLAAGPAVANDESRPASPQHARQTMPQLILCRGADLAVDNRGPVFVLYRLRAVGGQGEWAEYHTEGGRLVLERSSPSAPWAISECEAPSDVRFGKSCAPTTTLSALTARGQAR